VRLQTTIFAKALAPSGWHAIFTNA
jgi:hypothetical protein